MNIIIIYYFEILIVISFSAIKKYQTAISINIKVKLGINRIEIGADDR